MRALLLISALLFCGSEALAQKPGRGNPQPAFENFGSAQPERPQRAEPNIDVDRILPYLAYTLGELHYLAYACEGPDAQTWRTQMIALLAAEAPDNSRRRDRLIDEFNDGYREQQRFRAICGPQADAERRALAHRGRDLSEMMRSAYFD
ncbi:TIGR02301 family protein [Maricaulis sp.]|uniref:TIGR02301 family protein n=1 Tax=Maricaulis sp. TaxID=1486257 RepID=UPI00261EB357|nr:TIGR02301 family protein [Maricaulis sp.]